MKKILFIVFLTPLLLTAQSGGTYSFQSLFLTNNARTAALGGYNVSLTGDAALFGQNPALLDSSRVGDAVFMYNPFFVDINAATALYVTNFGNLGKFGFGVTYIGYGDFQQTDATGAESGTFDAQDYVITVGKAHRVGPFVLGANLKFIHSGIAGFSANAMAIDLGGVYQLPRSNFSAGMVISNLGIVLSDYTDQNSELPVQITAGITFKPEGMPVRFTFTGHNFIDPSDEFYDDDPNPNLADQAFKRISLGGELLISDNFHFLLGYDHNKKRELRLEDTAGGAGLSFGFMLRIKKYQIRYSRATYQAAGGTSYISIQSNLKDMKKIF